MSERPEGITPSRCACTAAAQEASSAAPNVPRPVGHSASRNGHCVCCEIRDGLATVLGRTRGHYVSRKGGCRMLVLECYQGVRIRINDTTEVVVLEIHPDQVILSIESLLSVATRLRG